MDKTPTLVAIPDEVLMGKIYVIKDKKVMLDSDPVELYADAVNSIRTLGFTIAHHEIDLN